MFRKRKGDGRMRIITAIGNPKLNERRDDILKILKLLTENYNC